MNYNTTLLAHDMCMDSRSREETLLVRDIAHTKPDLRENKKE